VDFVRPGEEVASSSWQLQSLGTTGKNSRRFPDLVGDWNPWNGLPSGKQTYKKLWKDPPCSVGKLPTINGLFSIAMLNYQRV